MKRQHGGGGGGGGAAVFLPTCSFHREVFFAAICWTKKSKSPLFPRGGEGWGGGGSGYK